MKFGIFELRFQINGERCRYSDPCHYGDQGDRYFLMTLPPFEKYYSKC